MDRFKTIINNLIALCGQQEDIKAVIAIGSQTRSYMKADIYSDLDIIVACDYPEKLLYSDEYISRLGNLQISFLEDTIAGQKERRVLFDGSLDVDFIVLPTEHLRVALEQHLIDDIMKRGFHVLFDRFGYGNLLEKITTGQQKRNVILSEDSYINLINDFYYHVIWSEKKICRGEIWTALMCIDSYLKNHLLKIIEMYQVCTKGENYDVWHNGRLLESWADEDIVEDLKHCFGHYDEKDLHKALSNTEKLFTRLARVCATKCGYSYPEKAYGYLKSNP